jgi:hypothetical protein
LVAQSPIGQRSTCSSQFAVEGGLQSQGLRIMHQ